MTIKLASLEVDIKAETDGEWIAVKQWLGLNPDNPYGVTELPGLEFQVRSSNHHGYKVARQKAAEDLEKSRKDYPDNAIPEEVGAAHEGRAVAEHLLLGWKGLDMDYTPEIAAKLLVKPAARNIRQMIIYCASKVGMREVEFVTATADALGK